MYTEFSLIYGIPVFDTDNLGEGVREALTEGDSDDFESPYNGGGHEVTGWVEAKSAVTVGPLLPTTPWTPELGVTDAMEAELNAKLDRLNSIEDWESGEPLNIGDTLRKLRKPGWYWVASDS